MSKRNTTEKCKVTDKFKCPICGFKAEASAWDMRTYAKCKTRAEKRDFKSITLNSSRVQGKGEVNRFYYECINCLNVSAGYEIKRVY